MLATLPIGTPTQAFIDGAFVDPSSGQTFATFNPSTGRLLAEVAACDNVDVDNAVQAARAAFVAGAWRDAAPRMRARTLSLLADLIEAHSEELAFLDSIDAGKTLSDCLSADLPDVVQTIRWYAEAADKVFGKISPTTTGSLGLIFREPVGVVAAILPWNFPLAMLAWKIAPALAAGNSVIIKPAELSSLSALKFAELSAEAGIPEGVLNVVPGPGETTGQALAAHPDVDVVTFTGSAQVGRLILKASAQSNLKRVVLELGGKSPQIVMGDVASTLDDVAQDLAVAAFVNAGQNCTAGSRVLVHNTIKTRLVDALVRAAAAWRVGDALDRSTTMGPLVEPDAVDRVLHHIERASQAGATVRCGGTRLLVETGGNFVGATILDDVATDMPVAREEIFGPVVCVLGFDDEAQALAMANDTDYGLAATVWTSNLDMALRMSRGIHAGTVAINGYSEGDITTPFGGYKQSGFGGRDKGIEALDQYTELKTVWVSQR